MPAAGRSWRRSAGVRFGLIYAALFGISALATAAFLWWATAGLLDRQTDEDIFADSSSLANAYQIGGPSGLAEAIEQRLANNLDDDALYLLTGPDFARLAGNLAGWPGGVSRSTEQVTTLAIAHAGMPATARVHAYLLSGGLHLLIGRDVQVRAQLARLLTDALVWAAAVMLLLGIVGAVTVRGLFTATLRNVSATTAAISAGDLGRRVRLTGRGDELDGLAETINDMLDRMSRLMDGVRQVSNSIAHDLRTPITRARARLEDAQHASRTEVELRAGIERAIADLDAVVDVFQSLLRIAEIESGSRRAAFAPFDLALLLRDLVEMYEAPAEERGQRLVANLDVRGDGRLMAYGDRGMVQQAVANLLDNALKFSPAGSSVRLAAAIRPGMLAISVADEGPGIPETDRVRATERFFRGESARHAPGSGLGLSLVQAVASLHGGTLTLEDNGPGLRAVLLLPAPPAAPARMDQISRPSQAPVNQSAA